MGKEKDINKGMDEDCVEQYMGLTPDEVVMLAYAVEYEYNDDFANSINAILEKIECGLHVDTYVGGRLFEHGKVMGWSKEL